MTAKIATTTFLSSIILTPHLPPRTWYFITTVTLSILNRPEEIPHVLRYALQHSSRPSSSMSSLSLVEDKNYDNDCDNGGSGKESGLRIVRRMREALIKSVAVGGLPKVGSKLIFSSYVFFRPMPAPFWDCK